MKGMISMVTALLILAIITASFLMGYNIGKLQSTTQIQIGGDNSNQTQIGTVNNYHKRDDDEEVSFDDITLDDDDGTYSE